MNAKYRGLGWAMLSSRILATSSRTSNTGEGSSGRSERRSARTRSSSGGSSGRNRSKLRQACSISLAARAKASSRGASSRSGESAGCSSIASMLPAPPQPVGNVGNRSELPPLHVLVDLVPDHDGGEPALRRDGQPFHPAHIPGGFLHAAQQVVFVLEPKGLGADQAHDHHRALAQEPDRLEAAFAPQVVPLHQEPVVGKRSEDPLGHG